MMGIWIPILEKIDNLLKFAIKDIPSLNNNVEELTVSTKSIICGTLQFLVKLFHTKFDKRCFQSLAVSNLLYQQFIFQIKLSLFPFCYLFVFDSVFKLCYKLMILKLLISLWVCYIMLRDQVLLYLLMPMLKELRWYM